MQFEVILPKVESDLKEKSVNRAFNKATNTHKTCSLMVLTKNALFL